MQSNVSTPPPPPTVPSSSSSSSPSLLSPSILLLLDHPPTSASPSHVGEDTETSSSSSSGVSLRDTIQSLRERVQQIDPRLAMFLTALLEEEEEEEPETGTGTGIETDLLLCEKYVTQIVVPWLIQAMEEFRVKVDSEIESNRWEDTLLGSDDEEQSQSIHRMIRQPVGWITTDSGRFVVCVESTKLFLLRRKLKESCGESEWEGEDEEKTVEFPEGMGLILSESVLSFGVVDAAVIERLEQFAFAFGRNVIQMCHAVEKLLEMLQEEMKQKLLVSFAREVLMVVPVVIFGLSREDPSCTQSRQLEWRVVEDVHQFLKSFAGNIKLTEEGSYVNELDVAFRAWRARCHEIISRSPGDFEAVWFEVDPGDVVECACLVRQEKIDVLLRYLKAFFKTERENPEAHPDLRNVALDIIGLHGSFPGVLSLKDRVFLESVLRHCMPFTGDKDALRSVMAFQTLFPRLLDRRASVYSQALYLFDRSPLRDQLCEFIRMDVDAKTFEDLESGVEARLKEEDDGDGHEEVEDEEEEEHQLREFDEEEEEGEVEVRRCGLLDFSPEDFERWPELELLDDGSISSIHKLRIRSLVALFHQREDVLTQVCSEVERFSEIADSLNQPSPHLHPDPGAEDIVHLTDSDSVVYRDDNPNLLESSSFEGEDEADELLEDDDEGAGAWIELRGLPQTGIEFEEIRQNLSVFGPVIDFRHEGGRDLVKFERAVDARYAVREGKATIRFKIVQLIQL